MDRSTKRIALLFAVVFAICVAGVFTFQHFWVEPGDRCEARGGWWDLSGRTCAMPIYIPDITGRAPGESREAASRRNAAELVELERRIAAARAGAAGPAAPEPQPAEDAPAP